MHCENAKNLANGHGFLVSILVVNPKNDAVYTEAETFDITPENTENMAKCGLSHDIASYGQIWPRNKEICQCNFANLMSILKFARYFDNIRVLSSPFNLAHFARYFALKMKFAHIFPPILKNNVISERPCR